MEKTKTNINQDTHNFNSLSKRCTLYFVYNIVIYLEIS